MSFPVKVELADWEEDPGPDPKYATTAPPDFIERLCVNELLDQRHSDTLRRALHNILRTTIDEATFAQIVDGAIEKTKALREEFDVDSLDLPATVTGIKTTPRGVGCGCCAPHCRLALSKPQSASGAWNSTSRRRSSLLDRPLFWSFDAAPTPIFRPTLFCLYSYCTPEQYPEGVADLPGYWAENRIFGGVVLFRRGDSGTEGNDVWFHPFREDLTNRVYALTAKQLSDLLHLLNLDLDDASVDAMSPLPILVDRTNLRHVDKEIAIPEHNLYRDRWERKIEFSNIEDYEWRRKDVMDEIEYPM